MNQQVLILNASPRTKGNSRTLASQTADGLRKHGIDVEQIYLHELDINPCNACDLCKKAERYCVIQDDMLDIYPKILSASAVILSSPIYWFTFSAQLKMCIDRWYGLCQNRNDAFRGKPLGILLTYGDTDLYTSGGINAIHTFESMCRYLEAPIAGIVYGSVSEPEDARNDPDLMAKAYAFGENVAVMIRKE
jgi:multimeric flavodoxin WrbA